MNSQSKQLKKNFIWNTLGSGLYSFTSLIFLIIVTRINGIEDAGIFTFAFSFACMIQVIALYAGRTYQVTESNKKITDKDYIFFKILCCVAMIIIGLCFCCFRAYDINKFIVIFILLLYKALDAFSESLYGVFQKNNNLYQCGISLTLKATICTVIFLIFDLISHNLIYALIALLLTDILIFLLYDVWKIRKYNVSKDSLNKTSTKILFLGGLSVCVFYFLTQYIVNTQKYVIDFILLSSDQTIFGIILMPATFMTLCTVFIFNPFTTQINKYIASKNWTKFRKLIRKIIIWIIIIGLAVLLISIIVGIPLLNIIYGLSLDEYFWPLQIIVFGSIIYATFTIMTNALISLRKNIIQMIIFLIGSMFSTFVSIILISNCYILGASIAYTLSMIFMLFLYIIIYEVEIHKLNSEK